MIIKLKISTDESTENNYYGKKPMIQRSLMMMKNDEE
jgi:hypothetical protein